MDGARPRIRRGALARMTGATALGLAVAPEVASAARSASRTTTHLHRSSVLTDGRAGDVGMDADALEDAFARVARRADRRPLPGRGRARRAPRRRRGRARVRRAPGRLDRGHDGRHALRPGVDDEGARDRDGGDDARRARQALARRLRSPSTCRTSPPTARATCSCATCCATPRACPWTTRRSTRTTSTRSGRSWRRRRSSTRPGRWSSTPISATGCSAGSIETVAGKDLDAFAKREIWGPLGMTDTTYNPRRRSSRAAPPPGPARSNLRPGPLRGSVQDDQDWKVGGIVGCDGASPRRATSRSSAR